ncbi:MAG: protein kinase [Chloroflexi bacterium]|nr:protein kinase [Chloroflexota bacterium]
MDGGNYRIERSLSKGGMGAVYLARDYRAFERLCVIKQMLEYYDNSSAEEKARAQQRFEEEGRTLASLSHPGVPRIYAFFIEGGRYYIVMEYIRGENLESFVTRENGNGALTAPYRRLPREEVIRYTIQLCRILEYLHALPHPVIHQDIKPANIILEAHLGEVRLVDFGTARLAVPSGVLGQSQASVYGTEGYAPPEQYQGHPVARSDVFSLAASIYHLLTDDDPRTHPFQFPKLKALPRELSIALEHALRVDPEQRSRAQELRQALESFSAPKRLLESFTFPGGSQIRSVGALPALCDEHWDAARSFLYNGDFTRWLRDLNRLDLVAIADETVKAYPNHDAGLEHFLRLVDPGIAKPKVMVNPVELQLGSVARVAIISRSLTLVNNGRGYIQAQLVTDVPWLEVYPATVHLWANTPVKVRISVHAQGLPLRKQQSVYVTLQTLDQESVVIPVTLQVSVWREVLRVLAKALAAALPEAFRLVKSNLRFLRRTVTKLERPFKRWPWLRIVLWAVLGAATGLGLYYLPADISLRLPWLTIAHPQNWQGYVLPVVLGPPLLLLGLYLITWALLFVSGALIGAVRGAWKSFTR